MSVMFVALPIALAMGAAGLIACIYCIRGGQFDDLESPPVRMLIDDDPARSANAKVTDRDTSGDESGSELVAGRIVDEPNT
ncbi:MAG: cbb3-type cytochrome oxidase assembly protein CcoS [Planctomycetota bacterium]